MQNIKYKRKKKIKQGMSDRVFNLIVTIIIASFLCIVLYPIIYVVSSSFSSGSAVTGGRVLLWPVEFSLKGYEIVFQDKDIWIGYINTIFYTVVGTTINLIFTTLAAYPLSRKNFQWRGFYAWLFIIPMYFGGGLIPTYILMSRLHLTNTVWIMIIGFGISNMIIMRTYFQSSVPLELLESAKMDGISDMGYLLKIALPLSKAVISVLALYYMVGHWNAYFKAMIYIRNRDMWPLQLFLREILNAAQVKGQMEASLAAEASERADVVRYALIVVAAAPMIAIYPFVQKFFEKGVMVGSLKG